MSSGMRAVAALALCFGSVAAAGAQEPDLAIRAVRYYRPGTGQTQVKAFAQVPYALLQPSGSGPDAQLSYQVTVRITDSSGMMLTSEPITWRTHVPAAAKVPHAMGMEPLVFVVKPGRYDLSFVVEDSVSGQSARAQTAVEGYPAEPLASDLVLSPAMRLAGQANDTVPGPGEIRHGDVLIVPVALLRLTPLRTRAYYLLEAYNPSEQARSGSMEVSVLRGDGTVVLNTPSTAVSVGPGGGLLRGQLNLDGLPEGRYQLRVKVNLGGDSAVRSAPFVMANLEETLAADTAERRASLQTDAGYFGAMTEAQLDSAEAPLIYLAKGSELRPYDKLSFAAKRRFLTEFWQRRNRDSTSGRNPVRDAFYGAIAYANQAYRVGRGRQEPGWRTDRGRIYIKYGAPDDQLQRPMTGQGMPYEVWRYTRGRGRYFVFGDRTGFGAYTLLQTNDLNETGVPNWRELLTEDAVRDIGQFLGIDFYSSSTSSSGSSF